MILYLLFVIVNIIITENYDLQCYFYYLFVVVLLLSKRKNKIAIFSTIYISNNVVDGSAFLGVRRFAEINKNVNLININNQ